MCEEKGGKEPEAKLKVYPVKRKEATGQMRWLGYSSWQRDTTEVYIQYIYDLTGMHQNTPRCRVPGIFKRRSQFGLELSSADRRTSESRCCVMQESSR